MEQALAVFSPSGVLTFFNAAYRDLWSTNPEAWFADVTIADSVSLWRQQCASGTHWIDIERTVLTYENRTTQTMLLVLNSGVEVSCQVVPIASAATLVKFQNLTPTEPLKLQTPAPAL